MADNPDIRIIVGVKGGSDVSGESAVLIKKELHSIAKKLSAVEHCPKITIRVDEGSTKKAIQNQLNKISKGLKITIGGFEKGVGNLNGGKKKTLDPAQKSALVEYERNLVRITKLKSEKNNNSENRKEITRLEDLNNKLRETIDLSEKAALAADKLDLRYSKKQKKDSDEKPYDPLDLDKAKKKLEEFQISYGNFKGNPALVEQFEKLQNELNSVKDKAGLDTLNKKIDIFKKNIKIAGVATKGFGQQIKDAFAQYTYLFSLVGIFRTIKRITKEMVANVKEVDSAMIELRKVTDESENAYDKFLSGASEKSKQLHTNLSEVVNATADFARIGYDIDKASVLAEAAIIYSNVGDEIDSIDDASNSLISSMKAFKGFEADPMAIVDKFNEVSNNFAISSGGIGEALQRSASSFATAGNTLDEAIALITAANTVVQNPESVGTAFKTMTMRIRSSTTELEAVGEEVDEYVKSASKMREEIQNLTGVDIMKDESTYKNTYQILQEISKVFGDLADVDKANVLEILFGKRQGNIGSALLSNFDIAEKALRTSTSSAGSAAAEFAKWTDSIEAKTQRFQATYQSLSTTVTNSDLVKFIVDSGTTILNIIDKITKSTGALGPALTLFGGIMGMRGAGLLGYNTALNHSGIKGSNVFLNFITSGDYKKLVELNDLVRIGARNTKEYNSILDKLSPVAKRASLNLDGTANSIKSIKNSTINLSSIGNALIGGLLNAGVSVAVSLLVSVITKLATAQKEARQAAAEASEEYKSESNSIAEYERRLTNLKAVVEDSNSSYKESYEARKEILSIQDELIKKYGLESNGIDLLNNKLDEEISKLKEIESIDYLSKVQDQRDIIESYFTDVKKSYIPLGLTGVSKVIEDAIGSEYIKEEIHKARGSSVAIGDALRGKDTYTTYALSVEGSVEERLEKLREIYANLLDLESIGVEVSEDLLGSISRQINSISESEEYKSNVVIRDGIVQALLQTKYLDQYSAAIYKKEQLDKAMASGDIDLINKAREDMTSFVTGFNYDGLDPLIVQFFEDLFNGWSTHIAEHSFINSNEIDVAYGSDSIKGKSKEEILSIYDGFTSGTTEEKQAILAIEKAANDSGISFEQALNYLEKYGYIIDPAIEDTKSLTDAQKNASAAIKGVSKDYDILNQSIEDMSADQLKELIEKYPELKDELDEFAEGAIEATEVHKEMNKIFKEERAEDLSESFNDLIDTFEEYGYVNDEVQDKIDSLIYDFPELEGAFDGVADAGVDSADSLRGYVSAAISAQLTAAQAEYSNLINQLNGVETASASAMLRMTQLEAVIADYQKLLGIITGESDLPSSGGGGGGKSSILSEEYEEATKLADHYIELSELTQERMKEGSEEWIAESEKQYEHTQKKAELIAKELDRLAAKGYDETNEEFAKLRREYEKAQNALYDIAEGIWEAQRDYQIDALQSQIDSYNKQKEQIEKLMDAEEKRWEEREEQLEYEISMQEALIDAMETYFDLQGSFRSERAELSKQLSQSELNEALYGGANFSLDSMFSEADYDLLTSKLDQIAGEADALYEDVLTQINDITKDNVDQLDIITESFQRQYELKLKEYEVAKQELAVARARKELENVMSERNVAMLVNGMWTWVADPKAVEDAIEAVNDAEADSIEAITELAEAQRLAILEDTLEGIETQKIVEEAAHEKIMEGYEAQIEAIEAQIEILENQIDLLEEMEFVFEEFIATLAGGIESLNKLISDSKNNNDSGHHESSESEPTVIVVNKPERDWISTKDTDYQKTKKYASGGVADYTGLARLDGSRANPEVVFNSTDAAKLYHLVHNTPDLIKSIVGSILPVGVSAPKIAKMFGIGNASTDNSKIVQVGNIMLNKEDSASIISILDRVIPTM